MIKIDVSNIKGVQNALSKYGDDAVKEFAGITKIKAVSMVDHAQTLVPKNKSTLSLSIKQKEINPLSYNVGTNEHYAPYMEFGTGPLVSVPIEFQSMANLAKSNSKGSFKEGLEDIKSWCKSKGIDVALAYPIFAKILNKGLTPKPFMYPAFIKARLTYAKDLQKSIKYLNKKFNNG